MQNQPMQYVYKLWEKRNFAAENYCVKYIAVKTSNPIFRIWCSDAQQQNVLAAHTVMNERRHAANILTTDQLRIIFSVNLQKLIQNGL